MPTYLRHKPTGDIMIATPYLMDRPDMELVEEPAPKKPAAKKSTAKKKPVEEVVEETAEESLSVFDAIMEE